jgi:hypothetical protein
MVAILVAFMFVSLVLTDLAVVKWKAWRAAGTARARELQSSVAAIAPETLWQVPEGVHLSGAHTWFRPDPAGGRSITVPCTITGKVMAVNSRLQDQPGLLNSDPYGSGWICHVIPTAIGSVAPKVRFGEKAILWLQSEFARLGEFLSAQIPTEMPLGATSQDGGLPSSGCLEELDKAAWNAFETEFLKWK